MIKYIIILLLISISLNAEESRKKIAIVDTGLNRSEYLNKYLCEDGHKSFISSSVWEDKIGHGTNVAGLIARSLNPQKHCLIIVKYYQQYLSDKEIYKAYIGAINYSKIIKVNMINLSVSGTNFYFEEFFEIKDIVNDKIYVSVSAGNGNLNLDKVCNIYPACYIRYLNKEYFHVVGSNTGNYSNHGKIITHWEDGTKRGTPPMTGTSQSTAIHTGKWAKELWNN